MSRMSKVSEYSPFNRSPPSMGGKKRRRFIRPSEAVYYDGRKAYRLIDEKWVRVRQFDLKPP
jgi:hypothetical protein